jgi:hypothetical protein
MSNGSKPPRKINMRINPVPLVLAIMEHDQTYGEACARARVAPETLKKIREGKLVSLKSIKKLCLSQGVNPREVIIHDVALTPTQGAQDLGNGQRPAAKDNGAQQ